jgi:magnesium transporter
MIDSLMSPPVVCRGEQPLREALAMFARHRFLALPVVDEEDRLLGVIDLDLYSEEAVDRVVAEREADVFQLIGVWMEQYQTGRPFQAYRLRMPWLVCNLVGGMLCAAVATLFAGVIAQVALIAAFIPLVLTLCESVAIQSLTLSLQRLHVAAVNWRGLARLGGREIRAALLLSATCALVVGAAALFWGWPNHHAALVLAAAILLAMCLAAVAGVVVPLTLRLLRLDPRVAAGPVVLMCVDVAALLVYLGLATLVLR